MDSEVTKSREKSKKQLKTLKVRLFPNKQEKEDLETMFDQQRWYYNSLLQLYKQNPKTPVNKVGLRNLLKSYEYHQEECSNVVFQEFIESENQEFPKPPWWKSVHNRVPRGAVGSLVSNLKSAKSNLRNGNIGKFDLKFRSKREPQKYLCFDDSSYPSFIKRIRSAYWFRVPTRQGKTRKYFSFEEILETAPNRGIEILLDKVTNRWFLHFPVEVDYVPPGKVERQALPTGNVISLDPGIRKFLVGYDPFGQVLLIGQGASIRLTKLLLKSDFLKGKAKLRILRKVKNLVDELHWKTIKFLLSEYDSILLPSFNVSQMIRGRKLPRIVKRLMNVFSFYKFQQRITWKAGVLGKKVFIVDESFTSKTCGNCGSLNNVRSKEIYSCSECNIKIDRDFNGARNILIKNFSYARDVLKQVFPVFLGKN